MDKYIHPMDNVYCPKHGQWTLSNINDILCILNAKWWDFVAVTFINILIPLRQSLTETCFFFQKQKKVKCELPSESVISIPRLLPIHLKCGSIIAQLIMWKQSGFI